MIRVGLLVLLGLLAGGCVSSDSPSNGALRVLHAVADAPRVALYVNDNRQISALDYRAGSAYFAFRAGNYDVRLDALAPGDDDPGTEPDPEPRTLFDEPVGLGVNDEVTLVLVGSAAAQTEEVLRIKTTTRGVPTGRTRLQAVHATAGAPAVDLYVIAPDADVAASTPFAAGLAFKEWTPQSERSGGEARLVVTAAGDPLDVLLDTDTLFLTLEGTILVAVVANTGLDAAEHPLQAVLMTGSGAGTVVDRDTPANLRIANVSPGSYTLDAFVNETSVADTERQECDPLTPEDGTLLEKCALAYEYVGAFDALDPDSYDLKVQKTAASAVAAETSVVSLPAAAELTTLITGLVADDATSTDVLLQTFGTTRRIAGTGQLRLVNASLANDAAIEGDPTTDRIEYYITPACAGLDDEDPDFTGVRRGSDTGYLLYQPGDYQVTVAKSDTATPDVAPVVLLTGRLTLASAGVYSLVIGDSVGGVEPLRFLSLDDDPAFADCPPP